MTAIQLTEGQERARDMVSALLAASGPAFGVLTGYAGTGKTTMLRVLADTHGQPLVITPTGKAALRLREATGIPGQTIHRWMYKVSEDPKTGSPIWKKKYAADVEMPASGLIIIDEASMVSRELWDDIWAFARPRGVKVLLVGDPFQLAPVGERGAVWSALTSLQTAHRAALTEVMRQALDSPIIRASMAMRAGEIEAMDAIGTDVAVVSRETLVQRFLALPEGSRVLIAHRNETRHALNRAVREALGYPDALRQGEPLLVLRNNYALDRFNGEVVAFEDWIRVPEEQVAVRDRWKNVSALVGYGVARVEGRPVVISPDEIFGRTQGVGETALAKAGEGYAAARWNYDADEAPPYLNTNLGYALTAHKAQGSEWAGAAVIIERSLGAAYSMSWRRYIYTAITRGKQEVFVSYWEC